jgi:hypothetical protein
MKNYPELKCYKLALQVSSSLTGSLKTSAEILDNQNRWSKIQGKRSIGRWAVGSTRTAVGTAATDDDTAAGADLDMDSLPDLPQLKLQTSYNAEVGEVADTGMLGVEIDVQLGQMTLRSKHLAALESEIANHPGLWCIIRERLLLFLYGLFWFGIFLNFLNLEKYALISHRTVIPPPRVRGEGASIARGGGASWALSWSSKASVSETARGDASTERSEVRCWV